MSKSQAIFNSIPTSDMSGKWEQIHFIENSDQLPTEINNTLDYPYTYEILKLTSVFQKGILSIVECKYELSEAKNFQSYTHAYVLIDKED